MNNPPIQIELRPCGRKQQSRPAVPIDRETRFSVADLEARLGAFEGARVVNISLGGLAVETHKHLEIGKSYPVRFKRPSGLLRLPATVVWGQLTRTVVISSSEVQPVYLAGLKFKDLSVSQKRELEGFLAEELARAQSDVDHGAAAARA